MKKFYYLKTCSTCQRIMKELQLGKDVELHEIKSKPLTKSEVERLSSKAGSFEAIFNKRARKLREYGLKASDLTEKEFEKYLNEDYSFLKRPLLETDNSVIAGNSSASVTEMKKLSS